jgi:hypothetical protein
MNQGLTGMLGAKLTIGREVLEGIISGLANRGYQVSARPCGRISEPIFASRGRTMTSHVFEWVGHDNQHRSPGWFVIRADFDKDDGFSSAPRQNMQCCSQREN